ncbi:MAG: hypothetical protein O9274_12815 [Limnobacter sp.]|uniref:hypothetical protein n=1 Tax=Limnobacter sp. TaxID=2003368 RepID=UPI0022CBC603|nr:hypothetical protein [Limnobacter sp.]MCZ8016577.1 hypothetical protein [Limnobacter sp.]
MDFLGHFEPDAQVSLAMVPEVMQQDPVAGVLLMTAQLDGKQTSALVKAAETGTLNAALLGQLFGPTNLPGNLANLIEAAAKSRFTAKMKGELKTMLASGKAHTVKLGNGVELKAVGFKGPNQFGKHADVLIRIRQTNAKQITLVEKNQFSKISKNLSAKSLGRDAFKFEKVLTLSRQMSDEMWELRRLTGSPWLSTIKVNAALTVLPTLVNDVTNNFNHHAKLDQKFNFKQFGMDSLVNQSSNLVATAGGVATAKIAAIFLPAALVAGAPLIVIGAIGTVVIGTAFTFYGGDKAISNKVKTLFGEDL